MEELKKETNDIQLRETGEVMYKSGSVQFMDSREVAHIVEKEHKHLLRDIKKYSEELIKSNIGLSDFFIESSYSIDGQSRKYPCYLVTKKGCEFIAHKLTGIKGTKFTATYINRFHEMEDLIKDREKTQIEELTVEIREFLLEHEMWQDTDIYFNGKRFTTRNPETKKYHYNDRKNLFIEDNQNPRDYFEYVADDHILSMSFEGPVYDMINGYAYDGLVEKFIDIFKKYGVYYEQGHAWNLTCYYE